LKEVIRPKPKVIQLDYKKDVEERLLVLESEINESKSFLLLNESVKINKNKKEAQLNGLGRIRTGDLRHVKAGDLALKLAFSCLSGLIFEVDETTTRNASAPS
jgi:hypothetical protein